MPTAKNKPVNPVDKVLAVLEISKEQVAGVPQITPILRKARILGDLIEFLRGSSDPLAKSYLQKYDLLPESYQGSASVEAVCVAAGIETDKLFGVIAEAVLIQSRHTAELLAAAQQPLVVQATVDSALNPLGDKDRKMLHQHSGFLPIPRTQIITGGKFTQNNDNRTQVANVVLPPTEHEVRKMSDRFNQRFIGGPASDAAIHADPDEIIDVSEDEE